MHAHWMYLRSGSHGHHTFTPACSIFTARFRHNGIHATELVEMEFRREAWFIAFLGFETYVGYRLDRFGRVIDFPRALLFLAGTPGHTPNAAPTRMPQSVHQITGEDPAGSEVSLMLQPQPHP